MVSLVKLVHLVICWRVVVKLSTHDEPLLYPAASACAVFGTLIEIVALSTRAGDLGRSWRPRASSGSGARCSPVAWRRGASSWTICPPSSWAIFLIIGVRTADAPRRLRAAAARAPPLPPRPPGFMPTTRRLEDLEPSSGDSFATTLYVVGDPDYFLLAASALLYCVLVVGFRAVQRGGARRPRPDHEVQRGGHHGGRSRLSRVHGGALGSSGAIRARRRASRPPGRCVGRRLHADRGPDGGLHSRPEGGRLLARGCDEGDKAKRAARRNAPIDRGGCCRAVRVRICPPDVVTLHGSGGFMLRDARDAGFNIDEVLAPVRSPRRTCPRCSTSASSSCARLMKIRARVRPRVENHRAKMKKVPRARRHRQAAPAHPQGRRAEGEAPAAD